MQNDGLMRNGDDLIFGISAVDTEGAGVTSGLTVTVSIQRVSDGNYWNDASSDFDLGTEPTLDSLTHVRDGLYEYVLTNGAQLAKAIDNYRFHIVITGTPSELNRDFVLSESFLRDANMHEINRNQIAAQLAEAGFLVGASFEIIAGAAPTASQFRVAFDHFTPSETDFLRRRICAMRDGDAKQQIDDAITFNTGDGTLTLATGFTTAPAIGDKGIIL